MGSRALEFESKRFQFRNGELHAITSLGYSDGYFSLLDRRFADYCKGLSEYLERLSEVQKMAPGECPFCSMTFDATQRSYINKNGMHAFVRGLDAHHDLWDRGLIVTSNRNGWHLVSELIIPRAHVVDVSDALTAYPAVLDECLSRWRVHKTALAPVAKEYHVSIYHGLVVNKRVGQSVRHCHFHCYTTCHELRVLREWDRCVPICSVAVVPPFEVRASLDDHPTLMAKARLDVPTSSRSPSRLSANAMMTVFQVVTALQQGIFRSSPPGSVGWFLSHPPHDEGIFAAVPVHRHGTIQVFQGDRFRKFRRESIEQALKNAAHRVSNTLPVEC